MQEGQIAASATTPPFSLQDKIAAAFSKDASTLVIASRRRCGKSRAIARVASEASARGEKVAVFVTGKRNASLMRDAIGDTDNVVVVTAADPEDDIPETFTPDCILVDDLAHIDPNVFFESIVPALMHGAITLFCVGENSGLMTLLGSLIGSRARVVNLDNDPE